MLKEGFFVIIMIYATVAHTEELVEKCEKAIDKVFHKISEALDKKDVIEKLKGLVVHAGFSWLT